jgi:hypothetical protein
MDNDDHDRCAPSAEIVTVVPSLVGPEHPFIAVYRPQPTMNASCRLFFHPSSPLSPSVTVLELKLACVRPAVGGGGASSDRGGGEGGTEAAARAPLAPLDRADQHRLLTQPPTDR